MNEGSDWDWSFSEGANNKGNIPNITKKVWKKTVSISFCSLVTDIVKMAATAVTKSGIFAMCLAVNDIDT